MSGQGPLGADSFSWDDLETPLSEYMDSPSAPAETTGGTCRPSDGAPRGAEGGRPTALGVDRRTPELREHDVLAHRARIDDARAQGLMLTEEALDSPRDWT